MQLEYLTNKKYIDITPYFTSQGIDKDHVHIGFDGSLEMNDEMFYVKIPRNEEKLLGELIAAKLLDKLNLPHVEYALGRFFDEVILLSKSFKKENYHYISGQRILSDYADTLNTPYDPSELNELEEIWKALENHYKKLYSKEQTFSIVYQLMDEITTLLSFDYVVGNIDRHQSNWVVEEGPTGIHLSKIFDNEYLLQSLLEPDTPSFAMASTFEELDRFVSPLESIETYLNLSSDEFVKKFRKIYEALSVETFVHAIGEVEHDLGCLIEPKEKMKWVSSYKKHHDSISQSIKKYDGKVRR